MINQIYILIYKKNKKYMVSIIYVKYNNYLLFKTLLGSINLYFYPSFVYFVFIFLLIFLKISDKEIFSWLADNNPQSPVIKASLLFYIIFIFYTK